MTDTGGWTIGYQDEKHKKDIEDEYKTDTQLEKKWKNFEVDVTKNPYYHSKPKRIAKLKDTSYPEGTYRYKKEPLRVVYYPEKSTKVIYPLAIGTATNIPYKKKSFKMK